MQHHFFFDKRCNIICVGNNRVFFLVEDQGLGGFGWLEIDLIAIASFTFFV
jgi:hypothetical protein